MEKQQIIELMKSILAKQGKDTSGVNDNADLRAISFRSLDFSELCLRIEQQIGKELNFEATTLRSITTVSDVCNFIMQAHQS